MSRLQHVVDTTVNCDTIQCVITLCGGDLNQASAIHYYASACTTDEHISTFVEFRNSFSHILHSVLRA